MKHLFPLVLFVAVAHANEADETSERREESRRRAIEYIQSGSTFVMVLAASQKREDPEPVVVPADSTPSDPQIEPQDSCPKKSEHASCWCAKTLCLIALAVAGKYLYKSLGGSDIQTPMRR